MQASHDFWNLPGWMPVALYVLAALAMAVFFLGFWQRASIWSSGKDTDTSIKGLGPFGLIMFSLGRLLSPDCMFARRVFPRSVPRALLLVGIMWGFIVLLLGTASRSVDYYMVHFLYGLTWQVFSLTLDIAGLIILFGTVFGLLRRYIFKPERFISSIQDATFLFFLLFLLLTGYITEGVRLVVSSPPQFDWSPVGYAFGIMVSVLSGGAEASMIAIYRISWMAHMLMALSFIAYMPYSKGFHIFASQISTTLAAERKRNNPEL